FPLTWIFAKSSEFVMPAHQAGREAGWCPARRRCNTIGRSTTDLYRTVVVFGPVTQPASRPPVARAGQADPHGRRTCRHDHSPARGAPGAPGHVRRPGRAELPSVRLRAVAEPDRYLGGDGRPGVAGAAADALRHHP